MKNINKRENKKSENKQEAIKHFRLSIIDAKLAYTLFKFLYWSRAESVVGKVLAEKYLWTQNQHGNFFTMVEYCAVTTFIIKIIHGFDNDHRALTLKDIDEQTYVDFIGQSGNKEVIKKIRNLRCQRIAHHDKIIKIGQDLPSFEKIDLFFENLENFYNDLTKKIENSSTLFGQDQDLKNNLEKIFQNLFIGEKNRLLYNELKWE
jgi:hypothetical protein